MDCTVSFESFTIPLRLEYSGNESLEIIENHVILPLLPSELLANITYEAIPTKLNAQLFQLIRQSANKMKQISDSANQTNAESAIPLPTNLIWNEPNPFEAPDWNAQDIIEWIFIIMFTLLIMTGIAFCLYKKWMQGSVTVSPPTSLYNLRTAPGFYPPDNRQIATYPRFREYVF